MRRGGRGGGGSDFGASGVSDSGADNDTASHHPPAPHPPPHPRAAPPTPTPTPTPTPIVNYDTTEYRNSNYSVAANAISAYNAGATGKGIKIGRASCRERV